MIEGYLFVDGIMEGESLEWHTYQLIFLQVCQKGEGITGMLVMGVADTLKVETQLVWGIGEHSGEG
jgi:hypothetical protein